MNTVTFALPESVQLSELVKRLGKSDRQIIKYRQLAYKLVPDYRASCFSRYPEYIRDLADYYKAKNQGKKVRKPYPDPPDFMRREAEILEAISILFDDLKNEKLVIAHIKEDEYFYLKPRYISKEPHAQYIQVA